MDSKHIECKYLMFDSAGHHCKINKGFGVHNLCLDKEGTFCPNFQLRGTCQDNLEEIVYKACNKEGIAKHCPERIAQAIREAGYVRVEDAKTESQKQVLQELYNVFSSALRYIEAAEFVVEYAIDHKITIDR